MFKKKNNGCYWNKMRRSLNIAFDDFEKDDIVSFIKMIDIFEKNDFNLFHNAVRNNDSFLSEVEKINPTIASQYKNLEKDLRDAGYFSFSNKKVSFNEIALPHKMANDFVDEMLKNMGISSTGHIGFVDEIAQEEIPQEEEIHQEEDAEEEIHQEEDTEVVEYNEQPEDSVQPEKQPESEEEIIKILKDVSNLNLTKDNFDNIKTIFGDSDFVEDQKNNVIVQIDKQEKIVDVCGLLDDSQVSTIKKIFVPDRFTKQKSRVTDAGLETTYLSQNKIISMTRGANNTVNVCIIISPSNNKMSIFKTKDSKKNK